ncbi:TetR/AcrR family transcriptional regulator [Thiomonas intermedia]|uniref:TetR/AcrR family transcriptional regulator n=1 Tax=Thiomonas intermedia TaxID=926 RepID=UPI0009A4B934|nr:TetR/AcrR family transcriptional regulator [Thiomonas intermedia]
MKVSREQAERNRCAVVASAARLFRERGFDGVGLGEVMRAAGLTHGGFYKQFGSKEDLVRESMASALARGQSKWRERVTATDADPLATFVNGYLAPDHRDHPADGCAFVAVGAEAARRDDPDLRRIFETEARGYLELIEGMLSDAPGRAGRDQALATLSTLVGALLMSRVVRDPELSADFLRAAGESVRRSS